MTNDEGQMTKQERKSEIQWKEIQNPARFGQSNFVSRHLDFVIWPSFHTFSPYLIVFRGTLAGYQG
jgi:hypothetical protein